MATERQITANRRNALRSTGPRTVEGLSASSLNALKHGMTSQTVVLPDEDPAEFERFSSGMRMQLSPSGALEDMLVERVIHVAWRLLRMAKIEAGIVGAGYSVTDAAAHGENVGAAVFGEYAARGILEKLCRYETSKERSLSRTVRDLERLQDRRRKQSSRPLTEQVERAEDQMRIMTAELKRLDRMGILKSKQGDIDGTVPDGGHEGSKQSPA